MSFQADVQLVREAFLTNDDALTIEQSVEAMAALDRIEKSRQLGPITVELNANEDVSRAAIQELVAAELQRQRAHLREQLAAAWEDGYKWGYDGDTDATNPYRGPTS